MKRLVAVLVLGAVLVGCSSAEPAPPPSAAPESPAAAPAASLPAPQPRPVRVEVAAVGIAGEVMLDGLGLDSTGGHAEPPVEQPQLASWYNRGPRPGEQGPAVVLGHVNGGGRPGIFARLHEVRPGGRVAVVREDQSRIEFEAYRVQTVDKEDFPTNDVYGDVSGSEIRLITCGGELDRANHRYLSNVIVYARLVQ